MQLVGKSAIVTGGAQGIGEAIARRFIAEGARVVVADIDDEAGQALVDELNEIGSALYVNADVGERLDVHNLVAAAINAHGDIDILVNNAGMVAGGPFLDITEETFDTVMRVNLKGTFLCSQAVARSMVSRVEKDKSKDATPGTIINMSSTNALLAIPEQVPYTVSKGAVRQLTNVMAQSLAPYGIRVNAIGPGSIATRMLDSVNDNPAARRRVMARTPLGRIGEAAEIAGIAVFLAGPDSSYITGQTIYADGGRLGQAYALTSPLDDEELD